MESRIFLVDFENINSPDLLDFSIPAEQDEIHIFYTIHATKISLDILLNMKARLYIHKVDPGKQNLDMQLVSYLGYLIGQYGKEKRYIIISRDTDYTSTISFWQQEMGSNICKNPRLARGKTQAEKTTEEGHDSENPGSKAMAEQKESPGEKKTKLNTQLLQTFAGSMDYQQAGRYASLILQNFGDKNFKIKTYRSLIASSGQKEGLKLYNMIKGLL